MNEAALKNDVQDGSWPLYVRPGYLVRRLYQIHVALFMECCAEFTITPVQYSILSTLKTLGSADQQSLAAEVSLDKVTTSGAVQRLEKRGLVLREKTARDGRARICRLTPAGTKLVRRMEPPVRKAHDETIAALSPEEQLVFVSLLKKATAVGVRRVASPSLLQK